MTIPRSHTVLAAPSDWVTRWSDLALPGEAILDVACGTGRHAKLFADKGCLVTAIDVSSDALSAVKALSPRTQTVLADIENAPWPLMMDGSLQTFKLIVVTNYLHRALMPTLLSSLANDGVLIYETFALGNAQFGKPSRPDFLLKPGELLNVCKDLHITAYENVFLSEPDRCVQRIIATKQATKMHALPHLL